MRFKNYIKEETDPIKVVETIQKNCKSYLNLLKNKQPFLRGLGGKFYDFTKKKTRIDRKSKGTSEELYPLINKWLEENGHVRRDRAVMVNSLFENIFRNFAHTFRNIHYMFPIGKFSYTWIKSKDFNLIDDKTGWFPESLYPTLDPVKAREVADELGFTMPDPVDLDDWITTNKGIDTAWMKGYEIWFSSNSYYVMSVAWEKTPEILRSLKLYKEHPTNATQIVKGKTLTFK